MNILKAILSSITVFGFSGCVTSNILDPKSHLEIILYPTDNVMPMYIIRSDPTFNRMCGKTGNYITWGQDCRINNANAFKELTLRYAEIPLTRNQYRQIPDKDINTRLVGYAQSLPPSAWRTYTIYPKQLLEKGQAMPVYVGFPNEPYAKNDPKRFNYGTRVIVTLYVDGNGNISQEIVHKPISRDRFQ